jgi:hypothetical protein
MTREQRALRRLKEIEVWAQAWVDYWTRFEELQKIICSYYDKPAAKAQIRKYQIILDVIDGKIDLEDYPSEEKIQGLLRFP